MFTPQSLIVVANYVVLVSCGAECWHDVSEENLIY